MMKDTARLKRLPQKVVGISYGKNGVKSMITGILGSTNNGLFSCGEAVMIFFVKHSIGLLQSIPIEESNRKSRNLAKE